MFWYADDCRDSLYFDSVILALGFGFLAFLEQSKSDIVNYKVIDYTIEVKVSRKFVYSLHTELIF